MSYADGYDGYGLDEDGHGDGYDGYSEVEDDTDDKYSAEVMYANAEAGYDGYLTELPGEVMEP
jgi:hypothetical protein